MPVNRSQVRTASPYQSLRFPIRALLLPSKPCRFSANWSATETFSHPRPIQRNLLQAMECPMIDYQDFATKALRDELMTRSECQAVLNSPNEQLLGLLQAAFTVRSHYFGKT